MNPGLTNTLCRCLAAASLSAALMACTHPISQNQPAKQQVAIATLFAGQFCQIDNAEFRWLTNSDEIRAVLHKARDQLQLGTPMQDAIALPNLSQQQVLLVSVGQRPNTGYRVTLTGTTALLANDELQVPVRFTVPSTDSFYPQVMTSPCLLISVDLPHPVANVRVLE
jgi:hypothetical protein